MEHYKDLLSHKKLGEEFFTFWDIETEKNRFYRNKTPIFFKDVDIDIVLVSNKISFGEKTLNTLLVTCTIIIKLMHYI